MTVLSLFDGMSCGQLALFLNGVKVDKYYASEIDKHAIKQTQTAFPNTIQLGDVTKVKVSDIDVPDLILAGSPCQGFSFAGGQLAFDDPRSALFFEFVRILEEAKSLNPNVLFLLENVVMKKEHERVITEHLGVFPVKINSALVSAQNRKRLYWTNIRTRTEGLFGEIHSDIPQPKDRGILLKDVLQEERFVDQKYYLSDRALNRLLRRKKEYRPNVFPDKTGTINTTNNSGRVSFDSGTTLIPVLNQNGELRETDKSTCIDANYHKGIDNHSQRVAVCVAMRGRNPSNPSDRTPGSPTEQRLEARDDQKTNTLTTVGKDNLILQVGRGKNNGGSYKDKSPTVTSNSWEHNNILQLTQKKEGEKHVQQQNRIYDVNGKLPALLSQLGGRNNIYNGCRLRRLTPLECARLQTVPDYFPWCVSGTQIYKMLGNGWTIDVIRHILSFMPCKALNVEL